MMKNHHHDDDMVPPFVVIAAGFLLVYVTFSYIQTKLSAPSLVKELPEEEREKLRAHTASAALSRLKTGSRSTLGRTDNDETRGKMAVKSRTTNDETGAKEANVVKGDRARRRSLEAKEAVEKDSDEKSKSRGEGGINGMKLDKAAAKAPDLVKSKDAFDIARRLNLDERETDEGDSVGASESREKSLNGLHETDAITIVASDNKDDGIQGQDESVKETGIRRASAADVVDWKADKASEDQFGFNIYGHDAQGSSCTCGGATVQARPSNIPITLSNMDPIQCISNIPNLPMASEALENLKRLAKEFEPVLKARGWTVMCLSEMCCCGDGDDHVAGRKTSGNTTKPRNVMGYCVSSGNGRTALGIHMRLRPHGSCHRPVLVPYEQLVSTMAHELAHIEISPHNAQFYQLMAQVERQRLEFMSGGAVLAEDGFPMGVMAYRLGGGRGEVLGSRELKRKVAETAQKRAAQGVTVVDDHSAVVPKQQNKKKRSISKQESLRRKARLRAAEERLKQA